MPINSLFGNLAPLIAQRSDVVDLQQALAQYGQPPTMKLDDNYFKNNYNTRLSPQEEQAYQQWAQQNNRLNDDADYDMRGAWKANIGQSGNGHYPDTFKKPNHPTFSDQSMYHGIENPNGGQFIGGTWEDAPGGKASMFTPSIEMVRRPGYANWMQNEYFPQVEPGNIFNMDRVTPQRGTR